MNITRHQSATSVLFIAGLLAAAPGAGSGATPPAVISAELTELDLPAQPLETALRALAQQAGVNIVFEPETVRGLRARALQGRFSSQQAVERLLQESGLVAEINADHTIIIKTARQAAAAAAATTAISGDTNQSASAADNPIHLARVETRESVSAGAASVQKEKPQTQTDGKGIPEILVQGRRSSNADIQRTEDDVQPYVVFDAAAIARSMAGSVEEFLKTRLPMNTVASTNNLDAFSNSGNQSTIDLRGLGPDQTLILVNGRRLPGVADTFANGAFNQPDINGIPLASIERIEVLPSTASGIYGGGATGGVINIVLKQDYSGMELQATYDNTFDTDVGQRRLDGYAGFSLEGGRTSIMVSGSYADANTLTVSDRDFAVRSRNKLFDNNSAIVLTVSPPFGYTSNIRSSDGQNLVLLDGTALDSIITHVPVGYAGPASDNGAALAANSGRYNLDLADDFNGSRQTLINDPVIASATLNARREFNKRLEVFVDLSHYGNKGHQNIIGFGTSLNLPAGAPGNPFLNEVDVAIPVIGFDYGSDSWVDSTTARAAGGAILRLPARWTAQAEYNWSRSRTERRRTTPSLTNQGEAALVDGTVDLFRDLNRYPLDLMQYALMPSPNRIDGPADTTLKNISLRLAGPTFRLPGGPLVLSALFETREEVAENTFRVDYEVNDMRRVRFAPSRDQNVDSLYLEARVPLVSAGNALPLVHELELQASVRRDEYVTRTVSNATFTVPSRDGPLPANIERITNEVESTDSTLGLRYSPLPGLALRASFGTGFLPPSISQLFPTETEFGFTFGNDPKRGGGFFAAFPIPTRGGGNPDLQPEESESWSAGAIFTPAFAPGLRLSVDYTRIDKSNEIVMLSRQNILDNEDLLPGRVTREELSATDAAMGFTGGNIIGFDSSLANLSRSRVEAFDFQVDYRWSTAWGTFSAYALATYQPHFEQQILPTSPVVNAAGFGDAPLEVRGNGGITLERGPWTVGWSTQYYGTYLAYPSFADTAAIGRAKQSNGGSRYIPSQIYHDLFARYRFDADLPFARGFFADTEWMVGIMNVFDTLPPILGGTAARRGFSSFGDPRLRRYTVSFRKSF